MAETVRVLLADDDATFLASLRTVIDGQQHLGVVGQARDGLEAIELADELHPDAIVMDLHMPQLDGVTAIARLRRDHPHSCLIALTGDQTPKLHTAAREAGADAVLLKENFVDTLMERLRTAAEAGARAGGTSRTRTDEAVRRPSPG